MLSSSHTCVCVCVYVPLIFVVFPITFLKFNLFQVDDEDLDSTNQNRIHISHIGLMTIFIPPPKKRLSLPLMIIIRTVFSIDRIVLLLLILLLKLSLSYTRARFDVVMFLPPSVFVSRHLSPRVVVCYILSASLFFHLAIVCVVQCRRMGWGLVGGESIDSAPTSSADRYPLLALPPRRPLFPPPILFSISFSNTMWDETKRSASSRW